MHLDYSPLIHLENIRELMLDQNRISDISFIANMRDLMTLVMTHNEIRDLSVLSQTPNLTYILLTDNQIRDLSPLQNLKHVVQLEVGYNQLSDLAPIANFSLSVLNVNDNQIKDLTVIRNYRFINELKVRNNPLTAASKLWVEKLKAAPKIKVDADEIHVTINGVPKDYQVSPFMLNGNTMLPMRAIFEELDAEVTWESDTQSVLVTKGVRSIKVVVHQVSAWANNEPIMLPAPPVIVNETTMVPVRVVSEMLGATVTWKEDTRTVEIVTE